MKNKIGILSGFVAGVAGFLLLFKLIVLDKVSPEDELAPGIVVIASVLNGVLFAFIGSRIQHYFMKKRNA
jgi:NhaP-type Na+/H+ or K+/H+ antiporter